MENKAFYTGFLNGTNSLNNIQNIEITLDFSIYNALEKQINEIQSPKEPEDPPETMHTPWGTWLRWRDPLHSIEQRFDTGHVLRTTRAAEDILHYYHYVPVIGEHEHRYESYGINVKYDYSHQEIIYNVGMELKEDTSDTEISSSNPQETVDFNDKENVSLENNEEKNSVIDKNPKNNIDFRFKKEVMKILEKIILEKIFGKNKSNKL